MAGGLFEGVRIIDCTHVLAGPFCSYQLALLGADVVRIEPPGGGDIVRFAGPNPALAAAGLGPVFLMQNANKRSLAVDINSENGKEVLEKLIQGADVFIENFRPGTMARLGFDAERCTALNPRLIYASITGYGQHGPLSSNPAYDHVIQAISGYMEANGRDYGEPRRIGFPLIDYGVGLLAAFAVAGALFRRTRDGRDGRGQRIDLAMLDAALVLAAPLIGQALFGAPASPRARADQAASGSPFSGIFETAEDRLAIAANTPAQGERLCRAMGFEELLAHPGRGRRPPDPAFAAEADRTLRAALLSRSAAAWEDALAAADVPAARVGSVADALAHPQVLARDFMHTIADVPGLDGALRVPGVGFGLSHGGPEALRPPPRPGADSRAVLAELGYGEADIERWIADGVVGVPAD